MVDLFTSIAADLGRPFGTARGTATVFASFIGLALVVAASFVRTMVPLRALTVAGNVVLLGAATLASNPALIVIYLLLVPINSYRLLEIVRLTRRVVEASQERDVSGIWLKPYMKSRKLSPGTLLFEKGDTADTMYLLVEGEFEWVEIGTRQAVGQLFGEISLFSPDRKRTLSGRCITECIVLCIAEPVVKQLYFQNPALAFHITSLIAQRLGADVARLQRRITELGKV